MKRFRNLDVCVCKSETLSAARKLNNSVILCHSLPFAAVRCYSLTPPPEHRVFLFPGGRVLFAPCLPLYLPVLFPCFVLFIMLSQFLNVLHFLDYYLIFFSKSSLSHFLLLKMQRRARPPVQTAHDCERMLWKVRYG